MAQRCQILRLVLIFAIGSYFASGQGADPAAMAREASVAMKNRQFEAAEGIYRKLMKEFPHEPGLALNLGLAQYSSGKFEDALVQFRQFLESHPDHGSAWLLVGVAHQKLDRPSQAVPALLRAVELDPSSGAARLELADALLKIGQAERAAVEFLALVEIDRTNPKAWLGLGRSYTEMSRSLAGTLERKAPGSPYHHLLLGRSAQAQGRFRAAFRHFRAALSADPGAPGAHVGAAEVYEEIGRSDWADAELAKRPRKAPCEERKFECWFEAGKLDVVLSASEGEAAPEAIYWRARALAEKAREAHRELLSLPPSSSAFQLLASIEELSGRAIDAASAWRKAVELEPADSALRRKLLRSLHAAGQFEESIRGARELLRLNPRSAAGHFYLGAALLELGRYDEAIPSLEAAVRIDPSGNPARVSLATAYLRAGRGGDAIPHLETTLREGEDERLLFQLSRAYQLAGRRAEALATLERRRVALAARATPAIADEISPP